MSLKLSEMEAEPDRGLLGVYRGPHNVLPMNRASVTKPRGAERTVLMPDRPQATPSSPGLSQHLLPSTWSFLIAWGKTLVTKKARGLSVKTSLVSQPQWHIWRETADEGEMLSEMLNTHYILHLFSFQKVRRKLALGHHFHTASWGFQARIGEVCSGPENLSNCPRPPLRLPLAQASLCREASVTQLGSFPWWGPQTQTIFLPLWITVIRESPLPLWNPFSLLQEGGVSWIYYGSMK